MPQRVKNMLKDSIRAGELFKELVPLVSSLGYTVVDVQDSVVKRVRHVHLVIRNPHGNTSLEDCSAVSRLVQPRLLMIFDARDIHLEVSSPGLSRNFKDVYEFEVFVGEQIKILIGESWREGILQSFDGSQVVLEMGEAQEAVSLDHIKKAKLAGSFKEK